MGCFLGCFGTSKDDKKRHKNPHIAHVPHPNPNDGKQYSPIHQTVATEQVLLEEPIKPSILETRVKPEKEKLSLTNNFEGKQEEQSSLGARKRVTFDSNVKEYELVSCDEPPETLDENEIEVDFTKPGKSSSTSDSDSTLSCLGSFPPNHRYRNCRDSDDEDDELCCEVSDLDDDEDVLNDDEDAYDAEYSDDEYYFRQVPEISPGSCSSMESGTKSSMTCAANDRHGDESLDKETTTPLGFHRGARDRAGYVHSVLNPVENTAQWKHLKTKQTSLLKHQKENFQIDLGFKQSSSESKSTLNDPENKCEVAVDASLSTWLCSSQKSSSRVYLGKTNIGRIDNGRS